MDIAVIDRMSQAGVARGPDVHSRWLSESAVFDYRGLSPLWSAGPEEHLLYDAASGVTVLLCGRIDGRAALREACAVAAGNAVLPDSDAGLVRRAYLRFGVSFAERLIGEFAFALWDSSRRKLILGRDPGGVGQLFYTGRPDGSVRFATGLNQLLAPPDIDRKPDFEGILDFYLTRGTVDPERSLIAGVRRVPPASIVVMSVGGTSVRQYWDLDRAIAQTESIPIAELPDACAEALQDAIRDRVRGQSRVGLLLSGGWDSGAIFQLWQWMRSRGESLAEPYTYSYYYSGYPEMDERREIAALLRRWPAKSCIARYECAGALPGLGEHCVELGTPEVNFMWRQTRQLAARARNEGLRVWLNGEGGNHTFECSFLRTADLLIRGRWGAAAEQNRVFARERGRIPARDFWLRDVRRVAPLLLPRIIAAASRVKDRINRKRFDLFQGPSRSRLAGLLKTQTRRNRSPRISAGFAAWEESLFVQNLTREYSNLGSVPAPEAVVASSPFLDARVAPIALRGMSQEPKPSASRSFMAATMATRLGASSWRGKYAFADRPFAETIRRDLETFAPTIASLAALEIIDLDAYRAALSRFQSGDDSELTTIWKLFTLEKWFAASLSGHLTSVCMIPTAREMNDVRATTVSSFVESC